MSTERRSDDLAAMLARAARRLSAAEEPLLAAHGVTMWEYIVLSHLVAGPAPNQLALAREIGHDKSRLVPLLDGLEARGLIGRTRDPADRRSQTVSITAAGREVQTSAQVAIRVMEQDALSVLNTAEKRSLLSALPKLGAGSPPAGDAPDVASGNA